MNNIMYTMGVSKMLPPENLIQSGALLFITKKYCRIIYTIIDSITHKKKLQH